MGNFFTVGWRINPSHP